MFCTSKGSTPFRLTRWIWRADSIAADAKVSSARFAFESMEGLLKVLTANRWALLRALRASGPSSVRALAKRLERDYRCVHADVALLLDAGLIARDKADHVYVPWSRITAEMALDTAA